MTYIGQALIATFDFVWNRLTVRLSGLADEEYFREPVKGCWSLRPGPDGTWRLDGEDASAGSGAGDDNRVGFSVTWPEWPWEASSLAASQ